MTEQRPERLAEGPSVHFQQTPAPAVEASVGDAERASAAKMISGIAALVTLLYTGGYLAMQWWLLAGFSAFFMVWHAGCYHLCLRGHSRSAGVLVIGGGTVQLVGISVLFLSPHGGTQIFIALLPLFALISIAPEDRRWAYFCTAVSVVSLCWIELNRDVYEPPFDVGMSPALHGPMRALAIAFTVGMIIGVFATFLRDLRTARKNLRVAHDKSESLLLNILPASIADRLKGQEQTIADDHDEASVLFADLVGFTTLSATQTASETVSMLNAIFSQFDEAAVAHGLEKIKTIGDAYMIASGIPSARPDHASQMVYMALAMQEILAAHNAGMNSDLQLRIGISSGPVTAGVIGSRKFTYDLWGDTVNVASRMESTGVPGRIQVTEAVAAASAEHFTFEDRGMIAVKGKGEMHTFLVVPPE